MAAPPSNLPRPSLLTPPSETNSSLQPHPSHHVQDTSRMVSLIQQPPSTASGTEFPPFLPAMSGSPVASPAGGSWSSLFNSSSKVRQLLPCFNPMVVNDVAEVPIEIEAKGIAVWSEYLVGYFVGGKLPFKMVRDAAEKLWRTTLKSMASNQDLFFFKFNNEDERQKALEQGSFFIAGKLFVIKPWSIQVEDDKKNMKSMPIWVNFFNVPIALWSDEGLAFVASRLGKPWCLDDATVGKERLNFARVCIEVSTEIDYPKKLDFKLKNGTIVGVDVEYPWKPLVCLKCNAFGHSTLNCGVRTVRSWKPVKARVEKSVEYNANVTKNAPSVDAELGKSIGEQNVVLAAAGARSELPINISATGPCSTVSEHHQQRRKPVAVTGTNPTAHNTIVTGAEEVWTSNRFDLVNIESELDDVISKGAVEEQIFNKEGTVGTRVVVETDMELAIASDENSKVSNIGAQEVVTIQGAPTVIPEQTSSRASNPGEEDSLAHLTVPQPVPANRVSSIMEGTGNYLKTINSCLDICSAIVEKPVAPLVGPMSLASDSNFMDKGGTKSVSVEKQFDPSNPDTWPDSIREADNEISEGEVWNRMFQLAWDRNIGRCEGQR